ncbi:MAG: hypothetical protein SH850_03880 [Planctomycetaceae bacterium]|nr:hypothetical protein [Planctomycetaceae bacterium]
MAIGTLSAPRPSVEDRIAQVVRTRTGGRIRGLCICIQGNRLVISGESSTFYDKQLASHAALESVEAFIVQNDLIVG